MLLCLASMENTNSTVIFATLFLAMVVTELTVLMVSIH